MILTVDKKKKFLITMLIIMGCATMINYGLYNLLNSYFKNSDTESVYSTVQLNIIIVLTVIATVTVIMVILIPKDNINELMAKMEGANTKIIGSDGNLKLNDSIELTDEEQLQNMIEEDLSEENKKDG
ncbi:MAG TPA: hypothetical protein VL854_11540 [Nitrososphaeraceae archaeon]|nr:hypothetical protein [Nitrososphaeraceae archaeon]